MHHLKPALDSFNVEFSCKGHGNFLPLPIFIQAAVTYLSALLSIVGRQIGNS
jgi:hypothetical protein